MPLVFVFQPTRRTLFTLAAILALATGVSALTPIIFSFDQDAIGAPPEGFFFAAARQDAPGMWEVRGTGPRRHLVHTADPTVTMRGISVAGITSKAPSNVKVAAKVRLIDGDRAGGVVWRYRDSEHFYFMSIFLSSGTASLVRVSGGSRVVLDIARDIALDPAAWHTVSIVHEGDQIRGAINGISVLRARDNSLAEGYYTGVWAAGNSTVWFDDVAFSDIQD